jgi:hypothetical protein
LKIYYIISGKIIIYALSLLSAFTCSSFAQTDTIHAISTTANVDLLSRYIWRGQEYGQSPSIQPGMSATWQDFTLGAWGAYKLSGAGSQETDFYISKETGPLTIAIWDYWSFCDTSSLDFFNYSRKTTSHLLEAQALLSGGEKLPFNLLGSYFFYGADSTKSIYFELQYQRSFGSTDLLLFAGFQQKGRYYAAEAAFVNIGCSLTKEIQVTDHWSLPLNISLIANPYCKSLYLVAGITL